MTALRLAVAQYPIEPPAGREAWRARAEHWVAEAAGGGARLLVFPENGGLEMIGLLAPDQATSATTALAALQTLVPEYLALWSGLARRHSLWLLAPGLPVRGDDGRLRSVATLCAPHGRVARQEKRMTTRAERDHWALAGGDETRVFDTEFGRLGVAIGYDAEFPLLVRSQIEAGARLILVPSCSQGAAGWRRTRIAARARALEGQCWVAQAAAVGAAPGSPLLTSASGAAAVFSPPGDGLPEDGVAAEGRPNLAGWVFADIDLAAVDAARRDGQALNHRDWAEQRRFGPAMPAGFG